MRPRSADNVTDLRKSSAIEDVARELQLSLWNNRRELFGGRAITNPIEVLDPGVALTYLGFTVETDPQLGEMHDMGRRVLVAGDIDQQKKKVRISPQFTLQEQLFTAAHELGHAVRHPHLSKLHRDRVVAGPMQRKDRVEWEADKFASCFLMPAKLVITEFQERFRTVLFELNDESAFGLQMGSVNAALRRVRCTRDMSMLVAAANSYMAHPFPSLAQSFGVSSTAMAIRLEELGLIEEFATSRFS